MDIFLKEFAVCLFVLIFSAIHAVSATQITTCNFPNFLKSNTLYRASYKHQDHLNVYFEGDRIKQTLTYGENGNPPKMEEKLCLKEVETGKYLVRIREMNGYFSDLQYSCMQFINRSSSVVQIKESREHSTVQSSSLCDETKMELDDSPLISTPLNANKPVTCPFRGGYNLKIVYKNNEKCVEEIIAPRMESECEDGDGITFDLRKDCFAEMDPKRKLKYDMKCVATWEHGKYTFIVLSDMSTSVPWCMRVEGPLNDIKHAYVFLDSICDPGHPNGVLATINTLILNMTKVSIPSICADESDGCKDIRFCDSSDQKYCYRSCGKCKDDYPLCNFPESLTGQWSLGNNDVMTIDTYKLDIPNTGKFHCIATNVSGDPNKIMLFQVFDNGCYPRFACLETRKYSKSTLMYRIGNKINWPQFPLSSVIVNTCKSRKFTKYVNTGRGWGSVNIPMIPVTDTSSFSSTNCSIPDEFGFLQGFLHFRESRTNCDICVSYSPRGRHDRIFLTSANDSSTNCLQYPYSYACAATFNFSDIDAHAVVTGTNVDPTKIPTEYICWVFVGKNEKRKILRLKSSECNKLKIQRVLGGIEDAVSNFEINEDGRNRCPMLFNGPIHLYPSTPLVTSVITRKDPTYRNLGTYSQDNKPINRAGPYQFSLSTFTLPLFFCTFVQQLQTT